MVLYLALGKIMVVLPVLALAHPTGALYGLGTKWDANYYELIAVHGYSSATAPYVFSPVYPAAIRLVYSAIGNVWVSALLVTNLLSFVFPILLYRGFGYRTALFAELFPTYLVFTTVAYSDVIALVFLAASLLFLMRGEIVRSSLAVSAAIFSFFNLAWTLPSFLFGISRRKHARGALFYAFPIVTGCLILLWFKLGTGGYFSFFRLEAPWGAGFANPVAQALYLLCAQGQGSFTCEPWVVLGIGLPPFYWLVRNALFEAFYLFGALYLLRTGSRHRVFLSAYCISVSVPLLFVVGVPALSVPRLLLPAFPVFLGYSSLLKGKFSEDCYFIACMLLAAAISVIQYYAFFA